MSESTQVNQSDHSESTPVIHLDPPGDTESTELIQSAFAEETVSTQDIHSVAAEKTEFTPKIKSAIEETESIQEMRSPFSESNELKQTPPFLETASSKGMQQTFPENKDQSKLIQPVDSEKSEPSEGQQKEISEEVNSSKVIPYVSVESNCETKPPISLSDSKLGQNPTNNINPYAPEENLSNEFEEVLSDDEKGNSSLPIALDSDSFLSLLDKEEYNDGKVIGVPGKGLVIVKPTQQCKPIFPDFVMAELTELIKDLSPTKDSIATKDTCDEKSLHTLLPMLSQWMQTVSEKIHLGHPSVQDFIEYSKGQLKCGLDILEKMNKRVNDLLDAAVGLPDPTSFFKSELDNRKISIRYVVIDAGVKVQQKLKLIEAETDKNHKMFVDTTPDDAKIWANKFKEFLLELFDKLLEEYQTLSKDVDNFRRHIREFCFEIEKLM